MPTRHDEEEADRGAKAGTMRGTSNRQVFCPTPLQDEQRSVHHHEQTKQENTVAAGPVMLPSSASTRKSATMAKCGVRRPACTVPSVPEYP